MNMFVMRHIDMIEVTDNPSYIDKVEPRFPPLFPTKPEDYYQIITREMVQGRIFLNERNERICFGMSEQV